VRWFTLGVTITGHPEWGQVTVEPNLPEYRPNATVSLRAVVTTEGKGWNGWEGSVDPNDRYINPLTVVMDSDKEISTSFKCGMGLGPFLPLTGLVLLCRVAAWRRR